MNNRPEISHIEEGNGGGGSDPGLLEAGLRQALRHEDPPHGFADRLLARAVAGDVPSPTGEVVSPLRTPGKLLHWPMRRLWLRGGIAAALILGLLEGESTYRRVREQQRRIAEATAQFQTTERVTVHALAQAREQLQRAGVPLTFD